MTKPRASRENRWGQRVYPVPNEDGEIVELPSVSRLDGNIYSFALESWKLTTVASEMAKRKDLVILAATDPKEAYKQALNAAQKSANIGSSIHGLSEQAEEGTLDVDLLSDDARGWVESYLAAKDAYGWRVIFQEETIFNLTLGYGGTLDRVMEIPGEGIAVVDVKTGRGVYGSSASQLACYAQGEGIFRPPASCPEAAKLRRQLEEDIRTGANVPEGRRKWSQAAQNAAHAAIEEIYWTEYARLGQKLPMPEDLRKDKAFLLHLFPDKPGILYPLRLDPELPAALSFFYRWSNDRSILGDPIQPPGYAKKETTTEEPIHSIQVDTRALEKLSEAHTQDLLTRARALPKELQGGLKANWPKNIPSLNKGGLNEEQLDFIEDLIAGQEALVLINKNFPGSTME